MNWKLKALIQWVISLLPKNLSNFCYYQIQRNFGALKFYNPISGLKAGVTICTYILNSGRKVEDKIFFEVGTGRVPLAPIAFWLCGAGKTYTLDINTYLKPELIAKAILYFKSNKADIKELFGDMLIESRFNILCNLPLDIDYLAPRLFELCSIVYISPGDARVTCLEHNAIDYHVSNNVYEHIPEKDLLSIINEGNRIIKPSGLFVNRVDYSDHFAHSDPKITSINFLKYSDFTWKIFAGNQFMFMNRLRHDDFLHIFSECHHEYICVDKNTDRSIRDSDLSWVNKKFINKSNDILAVTSSWFVTKTHDS